MSKLWKFNRHSSFFWKLAKEEVKTLNRNLNDAKDGINETKRTEI